MSAVRPVDGPGPDDGLIYETVLDGVASGVVSLDTTGTITSFNAAAAEIIGIRREAAVGHPFAEVFAELEGADAFVDAILDSIYETTVDRVVEAAFNGRTRTVSIATRYLTEQRDGREERLGVVAVFTDISELKELRETEIRLAKELESRHAELVGAYNDLEETNERLNEASRRMNAVLLGAGLAVLVLFASVGLYFWNAGAEPAPAAGAPGGAASAESGSLVVEPRPIASSITLVGRLAPLREVDVTSPITGKVAAVHVRPGDLAARGQPLVDMDVSDTRIEFREAQVAFIKARDRVAMLENWSEQADVSKVRRDLTKSGIALETASNRVAETELLLDRGIIPATEHEAAEREHRNRVLDHQSAEQDLRAILAQGAADLDVARLEFDNASARLEAVEETLRRASVTAPAAGVVMRPQSGDGGGTSGDTGGAGDELKPGAQVDQGDRLFTIGDLRGVTVVGQVDEVDVTRVRTGQSARIAGDAFPGIELLGTLIRVSSQAAPSSDERRLPLFEVAAAVDSLTEPQRSALRLGMSATLEVTVYEKDAALMVPIGAVETHEGLSRLRVRHGGTGEVRLVDVTTGITTLDSVEIVDGIAAGDEIVLP